MPNPAERHKELVLQALDRFERPLLRYATNLLNGDQDAARDTVQHAFLKLCERPSSELDGNQAPWLYTVCRNRAMDIWRKSKKEPVANEKYSNGVFSQESDPSLEMEKTAMLRLVQKLISNLAKSEREVAQLWSQGFTNKEMAKVTGRSEGAIRVCLHRAIKAMRANPAIKKLVADEEYNGSPGSLSLASTEIGQQK